ncbi:MAG TPA: AraC family transcriptional regulator [Stenomitos sp.]
MPEVSSPQHIVIIPLGCQAIDLEIFVENRLHTVSYREKDFASGCIEIYPTELPIRARSVSTTQIIEWFSCYLEPMFLAQIAYESVNPDRVELLQTPKKADLLIYQIGLALRKSLEEGGIGSRFYADLLATALSAHLLRHYSTRTHQFREHDDGLSKQKLRQAIEYMQAHLGEDLSLNGIATELEMSQYYFCHLFKKSTGMSPHQFLIWQRVERAKQFLKQPERTVASIAMECGFSSQSHFAKYFRQWTGMSPKQFRKL